MTDAEFDNISFRKGDIIEVRHFFKTEVEEVEYVDIKKQIRQQLQTTTNFKIHILWQERKTKAQSLNARRITA